MVLWACSAALSVLVQVSPPPRSLDESIRRVQRAKSYRFEIYRGAGRRLRVEGRLQERTLWLRFKKLEVLRGPRGTLARYAGGGWESAADLRRVLKKKNRYLLPALDRLLDLQAPAGRLHELPGWFGGLEGTLGDGMKGKLSDAGIRQVTRTAWFRLLGGVTMVDVHGEGDLSFDGRKRLAAVRLRLKGKLVDENTPWFGTPEGWAKDGKLPQAPPRPPAKPAPLKPPKIPEPPKPGEPPPGIPPGGIPEGVPEDLKRGDYGNPLTGLPGITLVFTLKLWAFDDAGIDVDDAVLRRVGAKRRSGDRKSSRPPARSTRGR